MREVEGRYAIAGLVVVFATLLYGAGLFLNIKTTPVEPQSVFTLYGAVLGYLFGSHEKQSDHIAQIKLAEAETKGDKL